MWHEHLVATLVVVCVVVATNGVHGKTLLKEQFTISGDDVDGVRPRHCSWRQMTSQPPSPSAFVTLRLGLHHDLLLQHQLDEHLNQIADPLHARYRRHLTRSEVAQYMRPLDHVVTGIHQWLGARLRQ
jgi:hypothetical protein